MVDSSPSKTQRSTTWRILIIDDDEDDFLIAHTMLKEARGRKFDIQWANTFTAGREALISDHYNAVLVDYDLGLHSGIELIREASDRGYAAPLILFTGRGSYEVDVEAMEAGATLYLSKSEATPLLLERAIRYAIELKHKEQSLRESEAALRLSEANERAKVAELNAIMDVVPAIVWITHDIQAKEVTGNQAGHDFLRIPAHKNLSKSAPVDAPRNFRVYQDGRELAPEELPLQITAATGQPIRNFEEEVVFDDGDRAYLLGNVTPLPDEDGKPCGAVGAFINITERKQSEQALMKAEERFAKAFHSSPAALAIVRSADGRYIEVNASLCQLTGYDRDEIIGHTALELGIYAKSGQRDELLRLLKEHGTLRNYEVEVGTKSGSTRTLLGAYDFIEVDQEPCILATLIDISERKQAEEAIHQAHQKASWMARLPDENPNPVARVSTDGMILYCNAALANLPGWNCNVGQPLVDSILRLVEQAMTRGDVLREDILISDQYYSFTVTPIRDENYANIYGTNITERKQAEAALQRSIERERARAAEMETLMDTVPAMIWIARDSQCREMIGNRYGYEFLKMWQGANISKSAPEESVNQQPYRNFKNSREIPTEELPMQVAAATGQPVTNYDFDLVFNDGMERTVLGNVNPLFDEQGNPSGAVAVFMDITDRKQLEEQMQHYARELERSNQSLQEFAFIASHDLQEPLRKIIMFGNSLRRNLADSPDKTMAENLDRIQNAAGRMQVMIHGLLDLSRVNTHGAGFAPVDLNRVVEEVIVDLEARIENVKGRVIVGALPSVVADELQMRQLFQNLIGNAIKFHQPDLPPIVRVSGTINRRQKPFTVEIQVEDNGIGFEQQHSERIFQPFQRLHARTEYEGTGLGLAICQKIVERHHGDIAVQSVPGQGTVFTIRLP